MAPPSTAYVTVAFGVPVKVITADAPKQIAVVPEIVAVGNSLTVTTAEPTCAWLHGLAPTDVTLTKL